MDFAEGGGQVAIDAHHEGHACDAGYGAANAARVSRRDKHGCQDSEEANAQSDGADRDGAEDAALRIDVAGRHQGENGECAADVHEGDERPCAEDGARQGAARIAHFFTHCRNQFKAGEGECDLRPEIDRVPIPRGHHVVQREMRGGAVAKSRR